jgi:CRP-like cAMP-binding protein
MSSAPPNLDALRGNRLLSLLEEDTLAALAAHAQPLTLELRDMLLTEGKPIRHAVFPVDGVVSMLASMEGAGARIEIGTVGNEGMVGLPLFLGSHRALGDCFAQVPGAAFRIAAAPFQQLLQAHADLVAVLHRYTQALMVQMSQSSACNRAHSPLQRGARWLLMTHDRVSSDSFGLTQEFLAQMLGERRPTVSRVASHLQDRGMITYSRGRIAVLDRPRLEELACPCYGVIRREYDSMLRASPSVRKRT